MLFDKIQHVVDRFLRVVSRDCRLDIGEQFSIVLDGLYRSVQITHDSEQTCLIIHPSRELQLDSLLQRFESPVSFLLFERRYTQELCYRLFRLICLHLLRIVVFVLDINVSIVAFKLVLASLNIAVVDRAHTVDFIVVLVLEIIAGVSVSKLTTSWQPRAISLFLIRLLHEVIVVGHRGLQ